MKFYIPIRKEEGSLRNMNAEKLLKTLPVLQAQLDGLLEFDCQSNDLTNGAYDTFKSNNSCILIYMSIDRCHQHELHVVIPRSNTFVCLL